MATQLEKILSRTRQTVKECKAAADYRELERLAEAHTPRGFVSGLRSAALTRPAVISELKKASPSKGVLRAEYHPGLVAPSYEAAGAAAISVLTDGPFFQGALQDLKVVSAAVRIPVLRKDFTVDAFQILEARAAGADAILLIVAAHSNSVLWELNRAAQRVGLDVLCEVHDREELQRAVDLGCEAIGVNCRNLKTLEVDLSVHEQLVQAMPAGAVRVAESGIRDRSDVERLLAAGYNAFLIGEALMREVDPGVALAEMLGVGAATLGATGRG
jgi:indole-3-glycerol phosphate synthase